MQTIQETEYLFRLTRFGMINCFLVKEAAGFTLIDTGLLGTADLILRAAEKLGDPIRRILLTHSHLDHVGSLDRIISRIPSVEIYVGQRESRLLTGDLSLDSNEKKKRLFGFPGVRSRPHRLVSDGDAIGSLKAVSCPGHTPGHMAYFDQRDSSLIAGDSFTTQSGVVVAGVFKPLFPFPALFSWDGELAVRSARKLFDLKPDLLCVGHGKSITSPAGRMESALEEAFRQFPGSRS